MVWGTEDGSLDSMQFAGIHGKGDALCEADKHQREFVSQKNSFLV